MRISLLALAIALCTFVQSNGQILKLNTIDRAKVTENGKVPYQLNAEVFEQNLVTKGTSIEVALPTGTEELEITRVTEFVPGIKSYRAVSEDGAIFSFTYQGGAINGILHESLTKTILFKVDRILDVNYIAESSYETHVCSVVDDFVIPQNLQRKNKATSSLNDEERNRLPGNDINEQATIDIMLSYTQAAEDWVSSEESDFENIDGVLAQAMNLVQTVFDNSEVPITFRLVHTHKVNYDESTVPLNSEGNNNENMLFDFVGDENYHPAQSFDLEMNEVHELRNEYGADIMSLIVGDMIGSGGVAFSDVGFSGSERGAFNINIIKQIVDDTYTLVHEIGHNLSLNHSRTQADVPSDVYGGLYSGSVGYQDFQNDFATVMGYRQEDVSKRVPFFSDPNRTFEGVSLGIDDPEISANAVQTLKQVKNIVASYRPTIVAPPAPVLSTAPIVVNLGIDETVAFPFNIQNTGESDLSYSIDFELIEEEIVAKQSAFSITTNDYVDGDTLLYSSFESNEDFQIGSFLTRYEWKADSELDISSEAPNSGSQHLRFRDFIDNFNSHFFPPFLGQLDFGTYKIGFSMKIPEIPDVEFTRFEVSIYDDKEPGEFFEVVERKIASITIRLGDVMPLGRNGDRQFEFATTSEITYDEYHDFEILLDSEDQKIKYFMDGEPLISAFDMEPFEVDFYETQLVPSRIEFYRSNNIENSYLDIDDISVIKYNSPYQWLSVENNHQTIKPDESESATLSFNTKGVEPGVYQANMRVITNNDGENSFKVPIQLTVTGTVSNEEDLVIEQFKLNQNYPNPFNPSTNITFNLPEASDVTLQVFDMLGRKVATLVNGKLNAGSHDINFDASSIASGMYIYTIQVGTYKATRKMMLLK